MGVNSVHHDENRREGEKSCLPGKKCETAPGWGKKGQRRVKDQKGKGRENLKTEPPLHSCKKIQEKGKKTRTPKH